MQADWTWLYRTGIGGALAIVGTIALTIMSQQGQMGRDISDLKVEVSGRMSGMDVRIGQNEGKVDMILHRLDRLTDAHNANDRDLAVLRQTVSDLKAGRR